MIVLDTDIFTLLNAGNVRVQQRAAREQDDLAITVITRIEVLMGRFAAVIKAAAGTELQRAQGHLTKSDQELATLRIVPIGAAAAAEFDKLRANKKLKNIGRRDLLIACIALGLRAKAVTRNVKHFRQVPGLQIENWAD